MLLSSDELQLQCTQHMHESRMHIGSCSSLPFTSMQFVTAAFESGSGSSSCRGMCMMRGLKPTHKPEQA